MGTTGGAVIQPSAAVMLFAAWLLAHTPAASGLWLALPPSGTKCVSEEIHVGVVALADYSVGHEDDGHITPTISAKVTSPNGNILHENKNATDGQFGFTTSEPGSFLACFWLDDENKTTGASVSINWKMGIAAQDWASVAKKEKIEGVELVLRKLESSVDVIHENLLYLRSREANMRDVSERTNSRVAMFSMMSIGVCILASALQLWHLKGYFEKKKLI